MTEAEAREAVVREAMTWLGTPYHHRARVKGAGVDCGQFLAAVYEASGVTPPVDAGDYPRDWMLHRDEPLFQLIVERYAERVDRPPLAGDVLLFRFGRVPSHGAIALGGSSLIHSYIHQGVVLGDLATDEHLRERLVGVWSPWS